MDTCEYVKSNYSSKTDNEIALALGISTRNVRSIRDKLGLQKIKAPHKYTKEQMAFLRTYRPHCDLNELNKLFNKRFGTDFTGATLVKVCRNNGIRCELSLSKLNTTTKLGDTLCTGRNRTLVRTKKGLEFKNRLLYEKYHNVKLFRGDIIVFLDMDKTNFSKDNLYKITQQTNMVMANNKWFSKNRALTLSAIKWCELFYAIKERED